MVHLVGLEELPVLRPLRVRVQRHRHRVVEYLGVDIAGIVKEPLDGLLAFEREAEQVLSVHPLRFANFFVDCALLGVVLGKMWN